MKFVTWSMIILVGTLLTSLGGQGKALYTLSRLPTLLPKTFVQHSEDDWRFLSTQIRAALIVAGICASLSALVVIVAIRVLIIRFGAWKRELNGQVGKQKRKTRAWVAHMVMLYVVAMHGYAFHTSRKTLDYTTKELGRCTDMQQPICAMLREWKAGVRIALIAIVVCYALTLTALIYRRIYEHKKRQREWRTSLEEGLADVECRCFHLQPRIPILVS